MSLSLPVVAVSLVLLSSMNALAQEEEPPAPAPELNAECARAYEEGQEQRKAGQLVQARETLQLCARDACPDFIRADCSAWYDEVQAELPTLVVRASSGGVDLINVRVSIGDREVATRIDGQAIEIDPGEHDLELEAPGMHPLTRRVVVARGERNRLLRVEMTPLETAPLSDSAVLRIEETPSRLLVPALAGVGALGLVGFGALGAWGRSSEANLRDTCSPRCSDDQVAGVRTKYLMADVSLGVGVVGLAAATYFFFSERSAPKAAQGTRVDVRAGRDGWSAAYGGSF